MPPSGEHARVVVFFFITNLHAAMSTSSTRSEALDNISAWSTEEVLALLRKNGLEECCKAIVKRQIDGDELLHLTDGKLALWKSDLTRPLIGKLWTFVQELNKSPERYLDKIVETHQNDDHLSDGSWGTDWEDEPNEESNSLEDTQENVKPSTMKHSYLQNTTYFFNRISSEQTVKPEHEETYVNCESCQNEEENTYTNLEEMKAPPTRNVSGLHSQIEKTLQKQNKELKHRDDRSADKPAIGPKPKTLPSKKIPMAVTDEKPPQKSFLHNESKPQQHVSNEQAKTQRGRMTVPPPPEPKKNYTSVETKKGSDKELVKRPTIIRHLDLVANLPTRTKESEDEYETFDEDVIKQAQSKKEITRVDSKLSLHSGRSIQGSVESVYKPSSAHEEEEDYELYESITEIDDSGYLSPIQRTNNVQCPPLLPAKPASPPSFLTSPDKTNSKENSRKRSPDKKSATLPHAGSNTSLSPNERATRPLPLPPDTQSYTDKPWYHNVTREQAIILIGEQSTYNNSQDGYFLLRPSTTKVRNPFVLVLWYKDRVYNVPVRKRNDNRYALGSQKVGELFFSTIEEIVAYYTKHELMLESGGVPIGSTILTDTPPK